MKLSPSNFRLIAILFFIGAVITGGFTFYNISNQWKNKTTLQKLHHSRIQDQKDPGSGERDTSSFHQLYARFQQEADRQIDLNIDTIRFYKMLLLNEAEKIDYKAGRIRTFTQAGESFRFAHQIDSSKYYFSIALRESLAYNDTALIERAFFGYGWMLIYDPVSVPQQIYQNLEQANQLAKQSRDTLYQMFVLNRMAQYYYYNKEYFKTQELCIESQHLAEIKRDTARIIDNLYVLESLYSDLTLYGPQLEAVNEALRLSHYVKDSFALYTIYRTASRAFLINQMFDSCLYYSRLNIPFAKSQHRMPLGLTHITRAYLETNCIDSARYYYNQILSQSLLKNISIDGEEYLDFGRIEFELGNFVKALMYYQLAIKDTDLDLLSKRRLYEALSKYYIHANENEKALAYLNKSISISDSIARYQPGVSFLLDGSKKTKSQIGLLTKNNELQGVLALQQKKQKNIVFGGSVIIFILLGIGFYRFQKNRDLRSKQALVHQRLRISRDLHDEVGTTLSGIVMYSHLAMGQVKDGKSGVENSIAIVQETASEMVNKLNDVVWLVNPMQDQLDKLITKLEGYAIKLGTAKQLNFNITVPEEIQNMVFPIDVRRNIYFICKEAINNAIKYSEGTTLELAVSKTDHTLEFRISDNGRGFDQKTVKRGHGLNNMQKRAEEINAQFSHESLPGKGTIVTLRCKLP